MYRHYGVLMDLRLLDEIEFWKEQEAEHTVVIQQLVPNLETQFVNALRDWQVAFARTQAMGVRYTEALGQTGGIPTPVLHQQIIHLVRHSIQESKQFIKFLNQLQSQSIPVRNSPVVNVVVNHIRRESEYFIGTLGNMGFL